MNWTEDQVREAENRMRTPKKEGVNTPKVNNPGTRKSKLNRWECEYALELEARKHAGEIAWYGFEAIKLRLTGSTFYTPDFAVLTQRMDFSGAWIEKMQFVEIKGFLRDDANVKFKVAAELFPFAEFLMYRKQKGGGWELIKHLNGAAHG